MAKERSKIKVDYILSGISCLVAIFALIVSVRSCGLSKESNKTAKEALLTSKNYFIIEQRPRLILTPKRFKDNNSFVKISNTDTSLTFECQLEVKNVGKVPAKKISLPKAIATNVKMLSGAPVSFTLPPEVTLAPNDHINMCCRSTFGLTKQDIEATLKIWESPDANMTLQIPCFYSSELDPSVRYKTKVALKFYKNEVKILKYEME